MSDASSSSTSFTTATGRILVGDIALDTARGAALARWGRDYERARDALTLELLRRASPEVLEEFDSGGDPAITDAFGTRVHGHLALFLLEDVGATEAHGDFERLAMVFAEAHFGDRGSIPVALAETADSAARRARPGVAEGGVVVDEQGRVDWQ